MILWLLLAVPLLLLVVLAALVALVALAMGYGRTFAQVVARLYEALCALSGTRVEVASGKWRVFIAIW